MLRKKPEIFRFLFLPFTLSLFLYLILRISIPETWLPHTEKQTRKNLQIMASEWSQNVDDFPQVFQKLLSKFDDYQIAIFDISGKSIRNSSENLTLPSEFFVGSRLYGIYVSPEDSLFSVMDRPRIFIKSILFGEQSYYLAIRQKEVQNSQFPRSPDFIFLFVLFSFSLWMFFWGRKENSLNPAGSPPKISSNLESLDSFFPKLMNAVRDGILLIDSELRVIYLNRSAKVYLEWNQKSEEPFALSHSIRLPGWIEFLQDFFSDLQPRTKNFQSLSGPTKHWKIDCIPFLEKDRTMALVILSDVTFYENVTKAHKNFVSNVSHELKTPITNIMGYSETMLDFKKPEEEKSRQAFEVIYEQSEVMKKMVEALLEILRLESGSKKMQPKDVSLKKILEEIISRHRNDLERKNIELSLTADEGTLPLQEELMFPIGSNLIENAVKFSEPGKKIFCRIRESENFWSVSVKDQGPGIPANDLPHLFRPFYTGRVSIQTRAKGFGLGLSMAKNCANLLGGTLEVKSNVNMGTEFILSLPKKSPSPNPDKS